MTLFGIRHKPSGRLMPAVRGRGYSALKFHLNGFEEEFARHKLRKEPRLFVQKIAAQRALAAWLKGEWVQHTTGGSSIMGDDYDVYTAPPDKPPADRKAEDFEIAEFQLKETHGKETITQ